MKKIIAMLLALMMVLLLAACGSNSTSSQEQTSDSSSENVDISESSTEVPIAQPSIKDEVIGTWEFVEGYMINSGMKVLEIYKGGTAKSAASKEEMSKQWYDFTWEIDDDVIKIKGADFSGFEGSTFAYTLEDSNGSTELHSTDGTIILVKTSSSSESSGKEIAITKDNVIGTWEFVEGYMINSDMKVLEIYKGGTAKSAASKEEMSKQWYDFTWEIDDDVIKIKGADFSGFEGSTFAYTLEDNDGVLELHSTDGAIIIAKQTN